MNAIKRFWNWTEDTKIPVSWLYLASATTIIVVSVINSDYDIVFVLGAGLALWAVYDIVRWRLKNRHDISGSPHNEEKSEEGGFSTN